MSDRSFLDSNILIYLYSMDEPDKANKARELVLPGASVISTQCLSETANVLVRRFHCTTEDVETAIDEIVEVTEVQPITLECVKHALAIMKQYKYSYYDSLILAAALDTGCRTVFSEDMQDGQLIEGALTIRNPFTDA